MRDVLVLGLFLLAGCAQAPSADLAIRDVTIVDVADGTLHPAQTVLVKGNRIVAVGPADAVAIARSAEVVDGEGGYLAPGLWDAHVHSATSTGWHFPLYLAHGITSVRNMHTSAEGALELVLSIKQQLADGEMRGPRFLANGAVIDGDPPVWPGSVVVRNAEEARAAVDRLADGGADFLKVYDRLSPEAYFAILERAAERGIPVDGHVPPLVPPEEAAASGQRTFEHTSGIAAGCNAEATALRADYAAYLERVPEMPPFPDQLVGFFRLVRRQFDARDAELCVEAARIFSEHGVVSVPTLVANSGSDPQGFVADASRLDLLPPSVGEAWRAMAGGPDPIGELLGAVDATILDNVRLLHEAGVPILAGTDVGNPFLVPGESLHRELERLTEAGLSPLEALQAATVLPARVFGLEDSLGTVEAGKLADLVLLEGDPLQGISNTRRIRAVIADGRLYRRSELDQLLTEASRSDPGAE
ncbi:MAG: hypothetical protein DWQ36_13850 [Acidobacteria bacterium]|nr:MAG: hypothetical protein DWQ30_20105 [Acidobacteriota bacterium]REK06291.1 MAG: hypothetical protein DWQ36_13850 [Acidobacteriota bacterium]